MKIFLQGIFLLVKMSAKMAFNLWQRQWRHLIPVVGAELHDMTFALSNQYKGEKGGSRDRGLCQVDVGRKKFLAILSPARFCVISFLCLLSRFSIVSFYFIHVCVHVCVSIPVYAGAHSPVSVCARRPDGSFKWHSPDTSHLFWVQALSLAWNSLDSLLCRDGITRAHRYLLQLQLNFWNVCSTIIVKMFAAEKNKEKEKKKKTPNAHHCAPGSCCLSFVCF